MSTEIAALLVAVGVGLSGVTLALALDGPALVAGWSAEAVILAWVARRTGEQRALVFSFVFLGLAALHTVVDEAPPDSLIDGVADLPVAVAAVLCVGIAALIVSQLVELVDVRLVLLGVGSRRDPVRRVAHDRGPAPGRCSRAVADGAGRAEHVLGHRRTRRDRRRARRRRPRASLRRAGAPRAQRREGVRVRPLRARLPLPRALVHRGRHRAPRRRVCVPARAHCRSSRRERRGRRGGVRRRRPRRTGRDLGVPVHEDPGRAARRARDVRARRARCTGMPRRDSATSASSTPMARRFPGAPSRSPPPFRRERSRSLPAESSTVSSPSCSIAASTPEVIDRVELEIPDREFVGDVEVLGSATGAEGSYATLSTTPIYAVRGAVAARSTTALFPSTDYRYLLVRARGVSGIDGATVARDPLQPRLDAVECGLERASAFARDRGDARSRVPERPRRRGRGAVEHGHVRTTSRRGGLERRDDLRLVGRRRGRALPRCRPRPDPGRRAPAIRAGDDR